MKKNNLQRLLDKVEDKPFISDEFHVLTNNKKLSVSGMENIPQSWIKIHFKTYPRLDKINFSDEKISKSELSEVIKKRQSIRQFSSLSISKSELYYLLFLSSGIIHLDKNLSNSKRPYPSAGARYPLEIYPIILNCKGIRKGLYHYNVKENLLELLLEENLDKWLVKNTGGEKWIKNAAVVLIITGVLDRSRIKYGDRGYRYNLIEAGA